jgi:hypothetical protein
MIVDDKHVHGHMTIVSPCTRRDILIFPDLARNLRERPDDSALASA